MAEKNYLVQGIAQNAGNKVATTKHKAIPTAVELSRRALGHTIVVAPQGGKGTPTKVKTLALFGTPFTIIEGARTSKVVRA